MSDRPFDTGDATRSVGQSPAGVEAAVASGSELRALIRASLFKTLVWLGIASAGLVVLLRLSADWRELAHSLERARPLPLALGVLGLLVCLPLPTGLRWRALLPPSAAKRVSVMGISAISALNILLGLAVSGSLGEIAAAKLMSRRFGVSALVALGASIHARLLGLLGAVALAIGSGLVFRAQVPAEFQSAFLVAGLTGILLAFGAWVLSWQVELLRLGLKRVASGRRFLRSARLRRVADGWIAGARHFMDTLAGLGKPGWRHVRAMGWTLVGYLLGGFSSWLVAIGLGVDALLGGVLLAYNGVAVAALFLFLFPAAYIGYDAVFAALLVAAAQISLQSALLVMLIVRTVSTAGLLIACLGLGDLTSDTDRLRSP